MSFANGSLVNPTIRYYENEKKNAIAPKITGKAKTALQEQIDAMFVETLASYVSDAASVARSTDTDPAEILSDLSSKIEDLSGDIDSFTDMLWTNLNADNKVSLFVRYVELESGKAETRIINKNK